MREKWTKNLNEHFGMKMQITNKYIEMFSITTIQENVFDETERIFFQFTRLLNI